MVDEPHPLIFNSIDIKLIYPHTKIIQTYFQNLQTIIQTLEIFLSSAVLTKIELLYKSNKSLISINNSFYMSAQEIVSALIEENYQDSKLKDDLIQMFAGLSKAQILKQILLEVSSDLNAHIDTIKDLSESPRIRKVFLPEIHLWMIRIQLAKSFTFSLEDSNTIQTLNRIILQNLGSFENLIKGVELALNQNLTQKKKLDLCDHLNILKIIFEELQKQQGEPNKNDSALIERMLKEATQKDMQQYLKELEHDIEEMPKSVIDYQMREIQIDLGYQFLRGQPEPKLSQKQKQAIQLTKPNTPDGKSAKQKVLQGEDVLRNLKILRKSLCGIDIYDIYRMIEKGRELKKGNIDELKESGKKIKVILLFGLSKAGKSTLIARILGYKMKKMMVEGLYTIQVENPQKMKPKHKSLVIGYSNKSTTRYPSIFEIPNQFISRKLSKDEDSKYYLMDSAGIEQSAGSEVEASNRISMIQFLTKVDCVSLAIVINQKNWGTRGSDIEKLASTTSSIIQDLPAVRDSITFVFNNFSPDEKETLHSNVKDLYQNIEKQGKLVMDKNFKTFFSELKYQTEAKEEIFFVDPLLLDPKMFVEKLWDDHKCIKDTSTCFKSDIGKRARKQIKDLCQRCKTQFKAHYEQNDIPGAQYYINLLKFIEKEPQLQSGADQDLISMKNAIEGQLKKKIKGLKVEFEGFEISFIKDKTARRDKLKLLQKEYQNLENELKRFSNIQKSEDLEKLFKEILEESTRIFLKKKDDWLADPIHFQELIDTSINALDFFEIFDPQTGKSFQSFLRDQKRNIIIGINQQIQSKNLEHTIQKKLLVLSGLNQVLQEQMKYDQFSTKVEQMLQSCEKKLTFIDLTNPNFEQAMFLETTFNEAKEVKKIDEFLKQIQLILSYPSEIMQKIKARVNKDYEILVVKLPKETMKKFSEMINNQNDDEDEGRGHQIGNIKNLIRTLKFLDNVEIIQKHHEGQLNEQFKQLETVLQASINRFMKISEAFNKNDSSELRKYINKMKSQFKQIENMIAVTESQSLKEKFEKIKIDLADSMANFIAMNNCRQSIGLKTINVVDRLLERIQKLHEFRPVLSILAIKDEKDQKNIQSIIKKLQQDIFEPIKNLKKEIVERGIYPQRIHDALQYFEALKNRSSFLGDSMHKIYDEQKQMIDTIDKKYNEKIKEPLDQFILMLGEAQEWQEKKFRQIQQNLQNSTVEKYRKAFKLLFQINQIDTIKEIYFPNAESTWSDLVNSCRTFKDSAMDKIELQKDINFLERLKKIISKIKRIEIQNHEQYESIFDELYQRIREKYIELAQHDVDRRDRLLKHGNDPDNFDYEEFCALYKSFEDNKTLYGEKNREELQYHFDGFRRNTQRSIGSLKSQIIGSTDLEKVITDMLILINKYTKAARLLKDSQPNFKITNLENLDQILSYMMVELISFMKSQNIREMKDEQIQMRIRKLIPIQNLLNEMEQNGIEIPQLKIFKQECNIRALKDYYLNQQKQKHSMIQNLKRESAQILRRVKQKDFEQIYQSASSNDQKQIVYLIDKQFEQKIRQLQRNYESHYPKFKEGKDQLKSLIRQIPNEIKDQCQKKINDVLENFERQQQQQMKVFADERHFDFLQFLQKTKKYKESQNQDKITQMENLLSLKLGVIGQNDPMQLWENNLIKNKLLISSQHNRIKQKLQSFEGRLLDKINVHLKKHTTFLMTVYNSQNLISLGGEQYTTENRKKHWQDFLILCSKLKKSQKQTVFQQSSDLMNSASQKMDNFFELFKQLGENLIQEIRSIISNPLQNENIDEKFRKIQLYKNDTTIISNQNVFYLNQSRALLKQTQDVIKEIFDFIGPLIGQNFIFADSSKKEFDEKIEETRIQTYEKNQKILQIFMNPYNTYLSPPAQITISNSKDLENNKNQALRLFKSLLRDCIQNEKDDQPLDKRLIYTIKIFELVASKPRKYLGDFKEASQECKQLLRRPVQQLGEKLKNSRNQIVESEVNTKEKFKRLKDTERAKINKELEKEQKIYEEKIKKIDEKFEALIKSSNQQGKKKLEQEKESEKKEAWFSKNKKELQFEEHFQQKLKKGMIQRDKQSQQRFDELIKVIITLKKFGSISSIAEKVNKTILSELKLMNKHANLIRQLYEKLNESENSFAGRIIDEFQIFNKMNGLRYQEQTKKTNSAQYVLREMLSKRIITNQQKTTFSSLYDKFYQEQEQLIKKYVLLNDESVINQLKHVIISTGAKFAKNHAKNKSSITSSERVSLLAKIFALWSIIASKEESEDQSEVVICYKAHAAQILCVIISIGADESLQSDLIKYNRLSQVKTGEGKSIVLAVLSIYFALFGYEVHCACYSEILSKRDQGQFAKLIKLCGVQKLVHYNIFENIIKKVLNQRSEVDDSEEDFSQSIKQMLLSKPQGFLQWIKNNFINKFMDMFGLGGKREKQKKILLIDEIDVLFDKNFYGDTFNLAIDIKDPTITALFQFIWKNKDKGINFNKVKASGEFKMVAEKYKVIYPILENQIHGMLGALTTYQSQQYVIMDKKILYKVQDSLMDISYGYNTVYAYMKEHEKNLISRNNYQQHLAITLCIAEFSYACLPQYYHNVMGVTGTLKCLPAYIQDHLKNKYEISSNQMFPIPSVYGSSTQNRKILAPLSVIRDKHFSAITENFREQFGKGRPILIFFRNKEELLNFYNSREFQEYQEFTSYITEDHNIFERNEKIRNSSMKKTITLMTNSYIRGIDFKLHDKKAIGAGGFHGIVTYLIDSPADYIQATGRVARQGKEGSFIEIFCNEDLQILEIDKNDPKALQKVGQMRLRMQQKQKESCENRLYASKLKHDETLSVFTKDFTQEKLVKYVLKKNKFPTSEKQARILLLVDATISMDQLFKQLKVFLPTIFDDTYATLEMKKKAASLQMQLVLYRNYNSQADKILQYSNFDNKGETLKNFIGNSNVSGGWGNQAIEVALQYSNRVPHISQIIIIGDARGNTKVEVQTKRRSYPNLERARIEKGLEPTCSEDEIIKLRNKGIKVHGFYLHNNIQISRYFEGLSKETGGKSQFMNIYDRNSSQKMTQFIVERALTSIGGEGKGGDELIALYHQFLRRKLRK